MIHRLRLGQLVTCVFLSIWALNVASQSVRAELTGAAWIDGDGEIEIHYEAGPKIFELHWHIGDGNGSTVIGFPPIVSPPGMGFDAEELYPVIPLVSYANFVRPAGSNWDFTGAASGSPLYILPLEAPPNSEVLPGLGLVSEELNFMEWVGGTLDIQVSLLSGAPGHLSIFDGDSTDPGPIRFSSFGGGPASFSQNAGEHYHHNFAFTAPGVYDVELTITGTHVLNGLTTGSNTFQFFVGDISTVPEPTSFALVGLISGLLSFRRARYRS